VQSGAAPAQSFRKAPIRRNVKSDGYLVLWGHDEAFELLFL